MGNLVDYLTIANDRKASDIFIVAGAPISMKIGGVLQPIEEDKIMPDGTKLLVDEMYELAKRNRELLYDDFEDDFSFAVPGLARYRVNAYIQRGSEAAVIRTVPFTVPDPDEMNIPDVVMKAAAEEHGMVLVTGTAGSGKSTTQACIIEKINNERQGHIITIEDPIEYLFRNKKCIISQREMAIDTKNHLSALRACLRQAPDVILVGELRDAATIQTALTAAETGHMLMATLHTKGAANSVDRIIDSFPADQQNQVRIQLSSVLRMVISQQLLPAVGGGMVPAYEVMTANTAVKNLIRDGKTYQIGNVLTAGGAEGMISMDQYILKLYQEGRITKEVAVAHADNPEQLSKRL